MKSLISRKPVLAVLLLVLTACLDTSKIEKARVEADQIMNNLTRESTIEKFPQKYFPPDQIGMILEGLKTECDYDNRRGKFVDFFSERSPQGSRISFIYEYFLSCDSIRFILKYDLAKEPELMWFFMEPIETENPMIIDKSKSLMNSK